MASTSKKHHHVAVFAFPFASHVPSLFSLTTRLAVMAPHAIFSFCTTPDSRATLASSPRCEPNLKLYEISDGMPGGCKPNDYKDAPELFLKAAPGIFSEALERVVGSVGVAVSCLLTDCFLWFARKMAAEMRVPWVAFWAGGACGLLAHVYTDVLRRTFSTGTGDVSVTNDKRVNIVPGFSNVRVCDLPQGIVGDGRDSFFSCVLHEMAKESIHATAVAVNTFEGLEGTIINDLQLKLHKCVPLGPLSLLHPPPPDQQQDPHACLPFLQRFHPSSVVYVSFGTFVTPPPAELKALAEGLEECGMPFLWSLKENAMEGLPEGFMERTKERGLIVPWAPQALVLAQGVVGAFVNQCGWSSVVESIAAGVPMIGRPIFSDNMMNGRMVSFVWEVGVVLDGGIITKEGILRSLDLVLRKEEGKRIREKIGVLKEVAKKAVRDGGSSLKSFHELLEVIVPS